MQLRRPGLDGLLGGTRGHMDVTQGTVLPSSRPVGTASAGGRRGACPGWGLGEGGRARTHQFDSYVFICIEILSCGRRGTSGRQDPQHTGDCSRPTRPRGTSCSAAALLERGPSLPDLEGKRMGPSLPGPQGTPTSRGNPHLPPHPHLLGPLPAVLPSPPAPPQRPTLPPPTQGCSQVLCGILPASTPTRSNFSHLKK